ncbi:MAG: group II intron reverse transcriptase/maturase [Gammaproteobacteria bacterium]|nr:group II intron reverse transcriptase/maturase [Gammaproteobacteria bacterium]
MSVPSIDRETWTTKLERLGKRAEADKQEVFNNLGHIIDKQLLQSMYQQMDGKKSVGIDGMNKERYGRRLSENLDRLIRRIRNGTYYPKPSRITEIPKDDGSKRPLAIACFEDKLVQAAVSEILTRIYEPLFLPCSYGFRRGRSCHDALRALMKSTYPCWNGAVVEIDICKYFTSIPHKELSNILQKKITDKGFLRLIDKLATAPVLENGVTTMNTKGCPQGSILSPILANIYLHEVIDVWFDEIRKRHFKGVTDEVRYVDDMVFAFENYIEAKRFFEVLPKRLNKYGLEMHIDKSRLIRSGQNEAQQAHRKGERIPTYQFLGFTVYWGLARNGKWWRMKFTSRRDRFTTKLKGLKSFLKSELTTKDTMGVLKKVARTVVGWLNYHAISDNERRVKQFIEISKQCIKKWINRRGRKRPMNWKKLNALLDRVNYPKTWKTISLFGNAC